MKTFIRVLVLALIVSSFSFAQDSILTLPEITNQVKKLRSDKQYDQYHQLMQEQFAKGKSTGSFDSLALVIEYYLQSILLTDGKNEAIRTYESEKSEWFSQLSTLDDQLNFLAGANEFFNSNKIDDHLLAISKERLELYQTKSEVDSVYFYKLKRNLAKNLVTVGQFDEARPHIEESFHYFSEKLPGNMRHYVDASIIYCLSLSRQGELQKARSIYQQVIFALEQEPHSINEYNFRLGALHNNLAGTYFREHKLNPAENAVLKAIHYLN